jgi:hypothetical protein
MKTMKTVLRTRIILGSWIRIRYPHQRENVGPDQHQSQNLGDVEAKKLE